MLKSGCENVSRGTFPAYLSYLPSLLYIQYNMGALVRGKSWGAVLGENVSRGTWRPFGGGRMFHVEHGTPLPSLLLFRPLGPLARALLVPPDKLHGQVEVGLRPARGRVIVVDGLPIAGRL